MRIDARVIVVCSCLILSMEVLATAQPLDPRGFYAVNNGNTTPWAPGGEGEVWYRDPGQPGYRLFVVGSDVGWQWPAFKRAHAICQRLAGWARSGQLADWNDVHASWDGENWVVFLDSKPPYRPQWSPKLNVIITIDPGIIAKTQSQQGWMSPRMVAYWWRDKLRMLAERGYISIHWLRRMVAPPVGYKGTKKGWQPGEPAPGIPPRPEDDELPPSRRTH